MYVSACVNACAYVFVYVCVGLCDCMCMCFCMYVLAYVSAYANVFMFAHVHARGNTAACWHHNNAASTLRDTTPDTLAAGVACEGKKAKEGIFWLGSSRTKLFVSITQPRISLCCLLPVWQVACAAFYLCGR